MNHIELPFVKMSTDAVTPTGPQKDWLGWIFIAQQII